MHIPLHWRMVTGTFTSRIIWNCSKRCTKTWERHPWCGAPRISSDHLCSITKSPRPSQGGRDHITQSRSTPLTSRAQEPPPRQEQLVLQCLSARRAQADRHFWRLDQKYSTSVGKKEPFPEPRWAKWCWGTSGSRHFSKMFFPLCMRWMFSVLWTSQQLFTRNSAQCWTSS